MEYPHTTITSDLIDLRRRLRDSGHSDLANMAASVLSQYERKKAYYTARIEELEENQPSPAQLMDELIQSLEESNSPQAEYRLSRAQQLKRLLLDDQS